MGLRDLPLVQRVPTLERRLERFTMATDAELRAAGFKLPVGNDYISEGDNAITGNAAAAYEFSKRFQVDFSDSGLSASTDRTKLGTGIYAFWNGDNAAAAGMPTRSLGTLIVNVYGSYAGMQLWIPRQAGNPELWISTLLSGGWQDFERIDAGAVENIRMLRSAAAGTLKSAPLALTLGYGGAQTTGTGTTVVIQHMPKTARRVQLHLENRNPRYTMPDSASVAISAAEIGLHTSGGNASSWVALPGTGRTAYTSGWIDVPEAWRGKDIAVRYAWSSGGSVQRNIGTGWTNGSKDNTPPLFAWLELEVPASTPVVATFGDSLASGVSSSRPVVDSFIDQYARQIGAVPTHWSHSGDKASGWTGKVERKWFMYGDAIAAPDAMVYFMGSNDLSQGANLAEMQARISETAVAIRAKLTPVLFGATLLPRTNQPAGSTFETVRRQVNAWLPNSGLFRAVFPFAAAVSSDDENLDPAIDADGVHLTTAGYGRLANAITQPLTEPPAGPYDSGTRNISSLITSEWSSGANATVTRVGSNVTVAIGGLGRPENGSGNATVLTLPVGFRPTDSLWSLTFRSYRTGVSTYGYVTVQNPGQSVDYLHFTYVTRDPAPSNPPGSPA